MEDDEHRGHRQPIGTDRHGLAEPSRRSRPRNCSSRRSRSATTAPRTTRRSRSCPTSRRRATSRRRSPVAGGRDRRRRALPDPARHHRLGQVGHHRLDDREDAAADADPGAEQVARRAARAGDARVLPEQPGRVLRQLLRLLPARGVHPVERHLHREGLVDQRRDRPVAPLDHGGAAHPARRDRRGVGVVHLRHGQPRGVPGQPARPQRRHRLRHAQHPAPARRHAVRPQRHGARPRQLPGARRHDRGPSGLRGVGAAHRDVRRHDRPHHHHRPADRRAAERDAAGARVPGHALRHRQRAHGGGDGQDRGRTAGAAEGVRGERQAARGAAPADAHLSTTSR